MPSPVKLRKVKRTSKHYLETSVYVPLSPEGQIWFKGALEAYKDGKFKEFEIMCEDLDSNFHPRKRWFTFTY